MIVSIIISWRCMGYIHIEVMWSYYRRINDVKKYGVRGRIIKIYLLSKYL